ncbi:MAG TPA: hypothetical protein VKY37_06590 [Brumimicrobium sp.]|nr:hypothetical protein [Brumimicrobium sp.]
MKENNTTKEGIEEVKKLANSYFELVKIRGVKKAAEVSTRATYGLLTLILIKMSLSFFGFALAIYVGELLESYALGFLIIGAVPLLAILVMRIFNRPTLRFFLNFFTHIMTRKQ